MEFGFACKCAHHPPDIHAACRQSDAIFLGRCLKAEFVEQSQADPSPTHRVRYVFHVQKAWKGDPTAETIVVETGVGSGDCGWEFRPGFSYIVYGTAREGTVVTDTCTRTAPAGFYPLVSEDAKAEIQALDLIDP